MNKAESARLASGLEELGYAPAPTPEQADIVVVNSCVVRQSAEDRVVHRVNSLRELKAARPDVLLALTGCIVDSDRNSLNRRFPHVDFFMEPAHFEPLLRAAGERAPAPSLAPASAPGPTAFITIIEGCDNFCSYCIVPYRRGREQSRSLADIRAEVLELVRCGVREVTLLGQNVDSYGHDLLDRPDLADLLRELNPIDGLCRIRFLTSHPKDMSQNLIDAVASLDKVCEYVSLPAQSGDDDILRAMGRGYDAQQYRDLVRRIRKAVPSAAISTDIIVGFPGEMDVQFGRTLQLISDMEFDTVHVAAYSPRPGTAASRELRDNVPAQEKRQRLREVEALQRDISARINTRMLGTTAEVLAERRAKGKWEGRTRTNKLVFFDGEEDFTGELTRVRIDNASPWYLQGEVIGRTVAPES
jgi:tRNA-2-methylthio-N6-dimethylallyladenosine synthase